MGLFLLIVQGTMSSFSDHTVDGMYRSIVIYTYYSIVALLLSCCDRAGSVLGQLLFGLPVQIPNMSLNQKVLLS